MAIVLEAGGDDEKWEREGRAQGWRFDEREVVEGGCGVGLECCCKIVSRGKVMSIGGC